MGQPAVCQTDEYEEFKSRLQDPWWRLNNLYYITNEDGEKVLFQPNWGQVELYSGMWYLNLVLKARQIGFTTFIQIFMLDRCLFNQNVRAGVIAHNREDAQTFFRDKIKYAYDNLPEWLKVLLPADTSSAKELKFSNNSSIRVGTSMRSGTLQYLHISEFGKICAKFPEKAKEIVTGSLNAVHAGNFVFIESTAEGQEGYFYNYCQRAENMQIQGKELTSLDWKFWFFPWWRHPRNRIAPEGILIEDRMKRYFETLEDKVGIKLDAAQKAWYVKKEADQGDDMKREHPSTSKEAFEASIEGAYFSRQMRKLRERKQITYVPFEPQYPIYTFWDLGRHDAMAVWFMQWIHNQYRFVRYYENSGENLQFYLRKMQELAQEEGYVYGRMFFPHDGGVTDLTEANNRTRKEVAELAGFDVTVVPRVPVDSEGIQASRDMLPLCWIDEENCADGIKCLDNYRKEWDVNLAKFKEKALHNWASHGYKAFETFARGFGGDSDENDYYDP